MDLYKVSISADKKEVRLRIFKFVGEKTKKSYVVYPYYEDIGKCSSEKRVIKIDKILKPDTPLLESHRSLRYACYCEFEDIEKAKTILQEKLESEFKKIEEEFNAFKKTFCRTNFKTLIPITR